MPGTPVIRTKRTEKLHSLDWPAVFLVLMLLGFGLLMVFDASVVEAYQQFSDKLHFIKLQFTWVLIGLVVFFTVSYLPIRWIQGASKYAFIAAIILLLAVLIPGMSQKVNGARRWLDLGFTRLQPSEVAKLAAVMYFPSWLVAHQRLGPFVFATSLMLLLIMLEPDLGTAIVIAGIVFTLYFVSGANLKKLLPIFAGGIVLVALLIVVSPYRRARLHTFFEPANDPLGSSYHIRQVLISLGSGGLTGTGIGRSRQKFAYLPEASTDSIFAVIAEEMGFVGAGLLLMAFMFFFVRAFRVAYRIEDAYAQLLAIGAVSWIAIQALLNLAAMVVLVPLTGVPLPFISYGGSSLVTILAAAGLYLNASRYRVAAPRRGRRNNL